jgi:hypothetical protein
MRCLHIEADNNREDNYQDEERFIAHPDRPRKRQSECLVERQTSAQVLAWLQSERTRLLSS